ncbi:MAG TPA: hypothetical protein GXX73_14325 [Clostridium sp.]|nr:hypothetical protein [Clostridium sp.]
MNARIFLIGSLILLLVGILLMFVTFVLTTNKNIVRKKGNSNNSRAKTYSNIVNTPFIGPYIKSIRDRLYLSSSELDEYQLRSKTINIAAISSSVSLIFLIFFIRLYGNNLYSQITTIIITFYINSVVVNALIGNKKNKILNYLPESIEDIKQNYHISKMPDVAIKEASKKAKKELSAKLYEIYNVLKSPNVKVEMQKYQDSCKDKFLNIIMKFSYLVMTYGDVDESGQSIYIKNLNRIMEEINMERIKKMKLNFYLKTLPIIVIIPIFFPPIIENWVKSNFPGAADFYNSSTSFFIKNFILFTTFICFNIITRFKNANQEQQKNEKQPVDYKILNNIFIKTFIKRIIEKIKSHKRIKLRNLLEDAGSLLNEECVYLRRIAAFILAFIATITMFIVGHNININRILSNPTYSIEDNNMFGMMGKLSDENIDEQTINSFDKQIIEIIKSNNISEIKEEIRQEVMASGYSGEEIDITTERILMKYIDSKNEKLKLWEIFLSILVAFGCSYLPVWMLYVDKSLVQSEMKDEVFQFHTIIMLLMNHKNTSVKLIIEWMAQVSKHFKPQLIRCLNNFHNPETALKELYASVKNKDLKNITENLLMATNKIEIKEAFDSLENDREYYKDQRKEQNEQEVIKKVSIAKTIAYLPLYITLFGYLVLPLILTSLSSMRSLLGEIGSI